MSTERPSDVDDLGPLVAPAFITELIAGELPELDGRFVGVLGELEQLLPFMYGFDSDPALRGVLHQASNAFVDALVDLRAGRGRPAVAAMRNLFDLLVTAHDVTSSTELAERYEAHAAVLAQLEGRLTIESQNLPKRDRSADLHRRKKLRRDSRSAYEASIKRYGSSFERDWAGANLKTRAERYGLGDDYDTFRLASGVFHGSSGGSIGLRASIGTESVVRTGPALAICPLAYLQVLRFYDAILAVATPVLGETSVAGTRREIRKCLRFWPKYRRAVLRVDRKLWPEEAPPPVIAIFAFRDGGKYREWHLLDAQRDQIIEADAPDVMGRPQQEAIDFLMQRAAAEADPNELITVAMVGVRVAPKAGAEWRDPLTVLPRVPAPRPVPTRIRLPAASQTDADEQPA